MRSSGAAQLGAWVEAQGGLRAAARVLGVGHTTIKRWAVGAFLPENRQLLAEFAGIPIASWDVIESSPVPAPAPPPQASPAVVPTPAVVAPRAPAPRRGVAAALAPPVGLDPFAPPPEPPAPPPAVVPATLTELQARARQIPGELQQLRARVGAGAVAVAQGEILARMLEREQRSLTAAITAAGTATVQEVDELKALIIDVTRGCEACRARVTAALRGGS